MKSSHSNREMAGLVPFKPSMTSHLIFRRVKIFLIICLISGAGINGQVRVWSVDDCIKFAFDQNIQIRQSRVSSEISQQSLLQSRALRYPSLSGSARQNFAWSNQSTGTGGSEVFKGTNATALSLTSGLTLYNASRVTNTILKAQTDYQAATYNVEVVKETVSLNILNAYLQVLYAEEQVNNSQNQISSTTEQLRYAEERLKLGAIANSDYLTVKSQLATEKQTLASVKSQLAIDKVTLLQLMELSDTVSFELARPNLDSLISQKRYPSAAQVYKAALDFKPEVKSAELSKKSSEIAVQIARSALFPTISLNTGLATSYTSINVSSTYLNQMNNSLSPTIGIAASIPIYTNRSAHTQVEVAKLNTSSAALNEQNTKNVLRKAIEQACLDVISYQTEYEASLESYQAAKESYEVATEKNIQGILSSVDFLVQKTNYITAESQLLQAKFALVFSYKILDFYMGKPLSL
jgi:outer membrane protein